MPFLFFFFILLLRISPLKLDGISRCKTRWQRQNKNEVLKKEILINRMSCYRFYYWNKYEWSTKTLSSAPFHNTDVRFLFGFMLAAATASPYFFFFHAKHHETETITKVACSRHASMLFPRRIKQKKILISFSIRQHMQSFISLSVFQGRRQISSIF